MNKLQIIIFFVLLPAALMAQRGNHHEKMQAEKVSYLTQKLDLTVMEAQKFWPVYNAFQDEMRALAMEKRKLEQNTCIHHDNELSAAEIEKNIDRMVELETLKAATEARYHKKFKEVLPIEKVAHLYHYEHEFRRYLLEKYRKHGRGGMRGGGNGDGAPRIH